MEQLEIFNRKLDQVTKAIKSFENLLNHQLSDYDDIVIDGLKNGQLQKFEYCTELLWKIIKRYLFYNDGIDSNSPKGAAKEFYVAKHINEEEYELLIEMIDDRNKLSHIYDQKSFDEIISRLPNYLSFMKRVQQQLK